MQKKERIGAASIIARLLAGGLIIAALGVGFFLINGRHDYDTIIGVALILTSLAAIGFFYLICTCFGICRFTLSEMRYSTFIKMFNRMSQAIVITDQEGAIRYMNESYRQLSGSSKCRPDLLFSKDEKAARTVSRLSQDLHKGQKAYGEIHLSRRLEDKDQQTAIYAVSISQAELAGETIHIWLIDDVTGRHNIQEKQFSELAQAIDHLDHAPVGFVAWDGAGTITYLNATLANWIGFDLAAHRPDQLTLSRLIGAQCTAELQQYLKQSTAPCPTSRFALDLFHEGGKRFPVEFHPCLTGQAERLAGRAVIINTPASYTHAPHEIITDFDEATSLFDDYFKACPIALAVMDIKGIIQIHNQHFSTLLPHNPTTQLLDLMPQHDATRITQWLSGVQNSTEGTSEILSLDTCLDCSVHEQGKSHPVRLWIRKLDRREPLYILALVATDEQRALEAHMAQGQKMQAVGQLAGGLAHDFNNVLTAIIMSCDLLLVNHRHSDPSHPDIMNIKNNAYRAAALVRQLLAFSRRQTLRPELLDVSALLADWRGLLTSLVGINIMVKIEHGRDLWPVLADRSELERAIVNLAANARDAMAQGGILTLRCANIQTHELPPHIAQHLGGEDYILIEVHDSGVGMAPEVREKIFEPFFTTKEVGRGTGLGLSTVYGIVTQTGGYIHCDSVVGQGTCFSLYLPRHIKAEQEEEISPPNQQPNSATQPLHDLSGSATILVVEDEDAVRRGSVKALQSRGYTVLEAENGLQALEIAAHQGGKIDLVISDVVMPEMDGPTLLGQLRRLYPQIKFIFVSGYAEDAFAKNLPEDANFAFLPKPFSLKQLALTAKEMLEEKYI